MWRAILAAMLLLQPPGRSPYSVVLAEPDAPAPCAETFSPLCAPPRWSPAHGAHVLVETREQGLARYVMIARAAERVVASREVKLVAKPTDVARYLVAFAYHESGFRRDVHSGVGTAARGDCRWTERGGRWERVPGSCRSHCLAQIQLGVGRTKEGWTGEDLTGDSPEATERCLRVAARYIGNAIWSCRNIGGPVPSLEGCVVDRYAGGGLAPTDPRLRARLATLALLARAKPSLSPEVEREALSALGEAEID